MNLRDYTRLYVSVSPKFDHRSCMTAVAEEQNELINSLPYTCIRHCNYIYIVIPAANARSRQTTFDIVDENFKPNQRNRYAAINFRAKDLISTNLTTKFEWSSTDVGLPSVFHIRPQWRCQEFAIDGMRNFVVLSIHFADFLMAWSSLVLQLLHCVSKTTPLFYFNDNFVKCRPIFIILSLAHDSSGNLQ